MISRCPSCGCQVKEDERRCGSCGWDFDQKKRVPLPDKQPPPRPSASAAPHALPSPPAEGFSLPLARNLNEAAPKPAGAPPQSKAPPPAVESAPPKEEAAFTLPLARGPMSPIVPPKPIEPEPLPEPEPIPEPQPEPEPAPALTLPTQPDDVGLPSEREGLPISDEPREREPAPKPSRTPPPPATGAAASRRGSPVYIAAVAGAAIGTVSVLAVYLLLRPEAPAVQYSASGSSPFARRTPPAEAVAPAPPAPVESPAPVTVATPPPASAPVAPPAPVAPDPVPQPTPVQPAPPPQNNVSRPAAVFAAPRATLATPLIPKVEKTEAPKAPPKKVAPRPTWVFEGVIFDLLTARGVFAAKLSFVDQDGNVVGTTSTGGGGSYKISVPVGGPKGYSLRISHPDYTERYIDEGDATSSLREATPEERKILMQAAARNLPWIGMAKNSVRRDLGLVPKTTEEP